MNRKALWGVIVILIIALGYWYYTNNPSMNDNSEMSAENGTIEGTLSYPSQFIPEDMQICAEDTNSADKYCTDEHIADSKYTTGFGYQLDVPAGTYNVYAYLQSDPEYRAYYNEFVTCGLSVDCESHQVIDVEVEAGETVSGIDPGDWYNRSPQNEDENTEAMNTADVETNIVGTWKSDADEKFTREFRADGTVTDSYASEVEVNSSGTWELFTSENAVTTFTGELDEGSVYLKINIDGADLHFRVTEATDGSLSLVYLDRGGVLEFSRVE